MPSSPQTVTTRGVFDYLYNSAGKAIVGATVNCTLNFNGSSVTSPIVNLGELQQATVTDQNGFWRFNLVPNDTITPSGTLYTINAGNIASYDISVPSGVADVQSSSILANTPSVLSPALTNLTGPITVTGNETVTGNLTVNGTTTLGSTTAGATTLGAATVGGDLTIGSAFRLLFGAAVAKIVPGATSISHRNNADNADNLLITDAGAVTVRASLTVPNIGNFTFTAGATGNADNQALGWDAQAAARLGLIKKAGSLPMLASDSADPIIFVQSNQAGVGTNIAAATLSEFGRWAAGGGLVIPPTLGGTAAPTSYGTVLVKLDEKTPATAASVAFSAIAGGFRTLILEGDSLVSDQASAQALNLTFNADTGANYDAEVWFRSGTAVNATNSLAASNVRIATLPVTGTNKGSFFLEIPGYSNSTVQRQFFSRASRFDSGPAFAPEMNFGNWRNTAAAITSITLTPAAGNVTGKVSLYGIP